MARRFAVAHGADDGIGEDVAEFESQRMGQFHDLQAIRNLLAFHVRLGHAVELQHGGELDGVHAAGMHPAYLAEPLLTAPMQRRVVFGLYSESVVEVDAPQFERLEWFVRFSCGEGRRSREGRGRTDNAGLVKFSAIHPADSCFMSGV